jgi:beta-galactosidase
MRFVTVVSLALALLVPSRAGGARAQLSEPFVAVGVWYPRGTGDGTPDAQARASGSESGRAKRELAAIKAAGFNSIRTVVDWASAERERGVYRFEGLGTILSAADEAGLKVIVQLDTRTAPGWLSGRYSDSRVVADPDQPRSAASSGYCMDHPGVRSDLGAFIGAAAEEAARHRAFYAIDVWRAPSASSDGVARFCYCANTQARFRDTLQRKYGTVAALNAAWNSSLASWLDVGAPRGRAQSPGNLDWRQFFAAKLQEDLKFRADSSAPRSTRPVASHSDGRSWSGADDWLMATAVDHYGTSISAAVGSSQSAGVLAALDAMRSAARTRSWWLASLRTGDLANGATSMATGSDLRV